MAKPSDDLSKTVEALIDDLDKLNSDATSTTNPKANTIAVITAIGKFSCLLTVLSRKADEQTQRVVNLTWGLFWLTLVLLAVALVQVFIMIAEHKS